MSHNPFLELNLGLVVNEALHNIVILKQNYERDTEKLKKKIAAALQTCTHKALNGESGINPEGDGKFYCIYCDTTLENPA